VPSSSPRPTFSAYDKSEVPDDNILYHKPEEDQTHRSRNYLDTNLNMNNIILFIFHTNILTITNLYVYGTSVTGELWNSYC